MRILGQPAATGASRLLGLAGGAVLGVLIGGLMVLTLSTRALGYRVLTVQSGSMEPTLKRGDLVFTHPVGPQAVAAGDIILFEQGRDAHMLVMHRVVGYTDLTLNVTDSRTGKVESNTSRILRTRGDNNPADDSTPVQPSELRGKLWLTLPGAGLLLHRIPIQKALGAIGIVSAIACGAVSVQEHLRRRRLAGGPPPLAGDKGLG
jgi:signal peptidase I